MTSETWVHDLLLFATAFLAAYAAWRGKKNGEAILVVQRQTDGLIASAAATSREAGKVEGIREGVALAQGLPPPGNGGPLLPGGAVSPPPV